MAVFVLAAGRVFTVAVFSSANALETTFIDAHGTSGSADDITFKTCAVRVALTAVFSLSAAVTAITAVFSAFAREAVAAMTSSDLTIHRLAELKQRIDGDMFGLAAPTWCGG